jgi:predicted metal-binding membrane protein
MVESARSGIFAEATAYLFAWGVMMAAMMLPSATPMITLYGTVHRKRTQNRNAGVPVALFTLVYLVVWLAFGIPVYLLGVAVEGAASASPAVTRLQPYALAIVLLAAGIYQLSPLKRVCLKACRSPIGFLMGHWQSGYLGTLKMGLAHATYCVGCCWSLMVVLVAAGAMALHWVLLITVLVFAEKLFPHGEWTARAIGTALIVVGALVIVRPGLAATW